MAFGKVSTFAFLFFCALASLCQATNKDCNKDEVEIFSKMVACVTKKHPEYLITILTKMKSPQTMQTGFMCSEQELMSVALECVIDYEKGCLPAGVSGLVGQVMPTQQNILRGIKLLCQHLKDFEHPCVKRRLTEMGPWMTGMGQCIGQQMQSYSALASSPSSINMRRTLCYALNSEERCLDSHLQDCPSHVISSMKQVLRAFFVSEDECPRILPSNPQVLHFQSEGRH